MILLLRVLGSIARLMRQRKHSTLGRDHLGTKHDIPCKLSRPLDLGREPWGHSTLLFRRLVHNRDRRKTQSHGYRPIQRALRAIDVTLCHYRQRVRATSDS